jgi:hypothetical protein
MEDIFEQNKLRNVKWNQLSRCLMPGRQEMNDANKIDLLTLFTLLKVSLSVPAVYL